MNKITSERSLEDDALVNFLQTYSPTPPLETKPCEDLVMRSIVQDKAHNSPSKRCNQTRLFWLLPLTFISGLAMVSGHLLRQKLSPEFVTSSEDIETFMVNTWEGSIAREAENEYSLYVVTSEY
jgi:hypothetical protein